MKQEPSYQILLKAGRVRIKEKIESSDLSYEYTDVKVEAPDSQTIIFKLETPFSPFPAVVSRPVFKKGLLGTGEWRVDEVSIAGGFLQKLVIVSDAKDKKVFKRSEERRVGKEC